MTNIAIRVENLSKLYTIGRAQQRHDTLRDAVAGLRLQVPFAPVTFNLPTLNLQPIFGPSATSPSGGRAG